MGRIAGLLLLFAVVGCAAPPPPASQKFVVFFQEWSAAIDDAGKASITAAARWANADPGRMVTVTGFADPEGSRQANIDISRTRAQVVMDQLIQDGVAAGRIRREARGPTDFTLSPLESRRVEIAIAGS